MMILLSSLLKLYLPANLLIINNHYLVTFLKNFLLILNQSSLQIVRYKLKKNQINASFSIVIWRTISEIRIINLIKSRGFWLADCSFRELEKSSNVTHRRLFSQLIWDFYLNDVLEMLILLFLQCHGYNLNPRNISSFASLEARMPLYLSSISLTFFFFLMNGRLTIYVVSCCFKQCQALRCFQRIKLYWRSLYPPTYRDKRRSFYIFGMYFHFLIII